jgi:hypothetical protein
MTTFWHYCATNDKNGNPRRVYVLANEDGTQLAAWDEGYLGSDAVPGIWRRYAYEAARVSITVKDYNRILRSLPSPAWASEVPGYAHLSSQGA